MAEVALLGITKSVLQQLASPALAEFRLLWDHKEHFEKLEDTVTTIRNVLKDADRKQTTDAAVQGWLARLRVVLYEADDLFDAISAKVLQEKNKKGTEIGKKVHHFISKPYRFAFLVKNSHKVKKIRELFDDISDDIKKYNFLPSQPDVVATSRIRRDQTHSFVPRNEVIGREKETEDVVRMLLSDCSEGKTSVSVIAIIGIGGLGKTTLAKLVYNDDRVQQHFDLYMWACINYFSDLKQVLITLLQSMPLLKYAKMSELKDLDVNPLQSLFRKEIEGKRFLLILDDVWEKDPQKWHDLRGLLSSAKEGNKVLITTRSKLVAQRMCATKPYFELQGLPDESAWLLFKKMAFEDEEYQNNSELEQLGRLIVRKCANVPLAIVTIASLLRGKEKERWPLVNDELSKVFSDDYDEKIMNTLDISYKELPYPVKRCFGYCSLFPKDFEFEKDSLIHLWIGQGFVEPLSNRRLEDVAEEYFFCLLDRCFFQLTNGDEGKKSIVTYQMHDFAKKITESESILVDNTDKMTWDKNICHVSINCKLEESMVDHVCSFSRSKRLRTFLLPSKKYLKHGASKKLMSSFKSLRVLICWEIGHLPTSIRELIHLRYLDLSNNYMDRLPSSICSLPYLQSLILRSCRPRIDLEFPKEMGDMLSLGHLDLSKNRAIRLPRSICSLPHLQSLILREWEALHELPDDLGDLLTSLRLLDLSKSYSLERLPSSICRLHHLESLILRECKHLKELPEELGDMLSLRHLVLQGCDSLVKMPPGLAALTSLVTLDRLVVHSSSGGLQYLEGLDNLTGSLQIELPSTEWESATTDAAKSSLSKKTRLHSLAIICKIRLDTIDAETNENRSRHSLEESERWLHELEPMLEPATDNTEVNALQLPPNLVGLSIINFGGKEMLNEVSCLHKLVILKLEGCKRCVKLPPLSHLPSLKELWISSMVSMLTIEESKSYEPNSFFPSLQTLSIKEMWNLRGWWLQAPTVLPTFPRLTRVIISNCQQLTRCIPLFPVVEHLELKKVREEIIWYIIGREATSTTSHGDSVLKKLEISYIEDLRSIEEAQIRHLSAIQHLSIGSCSWLESIDLNGLAYLTSLEHLQINKWGRMNWGGQEKEVRTIHLPRVRHLEIPTLNRNLFEGLKDMASLETLIVGNNFIEEFQEKDEEEEGFPWKHLRKLQLVKLVFGWGFSMRNNQRLLNGFQCLTSLKQLDLRKCKELYLSWRALLRLPHLHDLSIEEVEEVIDVDSDAMMIQTKPISRCISRLFIHNCLGEWVHGIPWKSLPFLKELRLERMRNLKSLPEGIQHLSALQILHINDNPGVASLPHWMSSLLSLRGLILNGCCEELKNRCNRQTGEDWPKIQHISYIDIAKDEDESI